MKRILIGLAIATGVGMICMFVAWQVAIKIALNPDCESIVLSEQKSPKGAFVLWVFRRDCGATTAYVFGISIRDAGDGFDPEARDEVFIMEGDEAATASWVDVDRVQVDVPEGARLFRSDERWQGVTITYEAD
jgi:hypothetical protein